MLQLYYNVRNKKKEKKKNMKLENGRGSKTGAI